jgi:hypothetical protein
MALMAATIGFCHWITSFDNRGLTQRMRALLGEDYSSRQATYDLRRLRRKQIICRIPGGHRYQLTQTGRAIAVLFTKAHGRILGPGRRPRPPAPRRPGPAQLAGHRLGKPHHRTRPLHRPRAGPGLKPKLDLTGNLVTTKRV